MSKTVKNEAELCYTYLDSTYDTTAACSVAVSTPIVPVVTMTKKADTLLASVGDTITYTVTIKVADGVDCFGVASLVDTPDETCSFVEGSVVVDGVSMPEIDLSSIPLTLVPDTEIVVQYQCTVDSY